MRLNLSGVQDAPTGIPIEVVVRQLCDTRAETVKMTALMREVLAELKEIKQAILKNNETVAAGIAKADEALAEAQLTRAELSSTKTRIAEVKTAVEEETRSRRG